MEFSIILLFILNIYLCDGDTSEEDNFVIDLAHYGSDLYKIPTKEAGENLEKWFENHPDGAYAEMQGPYLEGDIVSSPTSQGRAGREKRYRWPNGRIPIQFSPTSNFNSFELNQIRIAIAIYHKNTCIRFVRRTTEVDYVVFSNAKLGCFSDIGRRGKKQRLNLQRDGCFTKIGTVLHEMMHTIGFLHEHVRDDRDQFVRIHYENIKQDQIRNFEKFTPNATSSFGVAYNYGSVMHYPEKSFSKNGNKTITVINSTNQKIGQRDKLSDSDLIQINRMYNCKGNVKN